MSKGIKMMLIFAIAVSLLVSTGLLNDVSSQTSGSASVSAPAIAWQKDYGYNGVDDEIGVELASNLIQTSDGGFVYWTDGSITKTDSKNKTQWLKILTYPTIDAYPTYTYPLELRSLIETSDGALAALGVGYRLLNNPLTGKIYLIKTEPFLPLPTQTPLPTPIPTPEVTPTFPDSPLLIVASAIIIGTVIAVTAYVWKKKH